MNDIEKYISPFIAQQFPSFYKEQGPNFIAFVKAYYEWLEQTNNAINHSRSLLNYSDIDKTKDQFLTDFKNQYLLSIPEETVVDKRLMLKHIQDLYRAKGSKRAVELLFRLIYGEDIDLYIPSEYIFKPSDNIWKVPRYIEVTSNDNLPKIAGSKIQTPGNTATAIVESVSSKIVNGKTVNILELSAIRGVFRRGDRIFQSNGTYITSTNAPIVTGSLTAIAISTGGQNYSVGDILDVVGSGIEGKARVTSITNNFNGGLSFSILNGGSGYTLNAIVTVKTSINIGIDNLNGNILIGQSISDTTTNANGTVVFANNSLVKLINFSNNLIFTTGNMISGPSGNAVITRITGGTGSGGSFRVGSITNKELITYNTNIIEPYLNLQLDYTDNSFRLGVSSVSGTFTANDTVTSTANAIFLECILVSSNQVSNGESFSNSSLGISGLYVYRSDKTLIYCTGSDTDITNANLVSGTILISNTSSSVISLIHRPEKQTVNATALVVSSNSTSILLSSVNGYFVSTKTLTDSNTAATATIGTVQRLTDWQFASSISLLDNLDSIIDESLPLTTAEVGTIQSLSQVNPGSGYLTSPHITVIEPDIAALSILDSNLTQKGNNAIIGSTIVGGNGAVAAVEVINSGYGYLDSDSVTLTNLINDNLISGTSIVYRSGRGQGRWLNRKSFSSDVIKLQDGFFYQDYSYQIIAQRMLESYESLVRDLVHPSGIALFGAFRLNDYIVDEQDTISESSITQQ